MRRRELRRLLTAWSILCGIGATLGGLWGILTRENDDHALG